MTLTSKRLAETDVKTNINTSSYNPHVRRNFLASVSDAEIPVGYARIQLLGNSIYEPRHEKQCLMRPPNSSDKSASSAELKKLVQQQLD